MCMTVVLAFVRVPVVVASVRVAVACSAVGVTVARSTDIRSMRMASFMGVAVRSANTTSSMGVRVSKNLQDQKVAE